MYNHVKLKNNQLKTCFILVLKIFGKIKNNQLKTCFILVLKIF